MSATLINGILPLNVSHVHVKIHITMSKMHIAMSKFYIAV
jgi:hypothetical protein